MTAAAINLLFELLRPQPTKTKMFKSVACNIAKVFVALNARLNVRQVTDSLQIDGIPTKACIGIRIRERYLCVWSPQQHPFHGDS